MNDNTNNNLSNSQTNPNANGGSVVLNNVQPVTPAINNPTLEPVVNPTPVNNQVVSDNVVTPSAPVVNEVGTPNNPTVVESLQTNNGVVEAQNTNTVIQPQTISSPVESIPVQADPSVAYTNPQTITQVAMPGFENPGTIGTTPPISLEPEKKPKKKSNKILFVIIILVALAFVGGGTFYVLKYTDFLSPTKNVKITTKDINHTLGSKLTEDIEDYATITGTDINNCTLNSTNVDINKEGSYTFEISCGEIIKIGKVNVIDNSELEIQVKDVYKVKGDTSIKAEDFVVDPDNDITYELIKEDTVKNYLAAEGSYHVTVKASKKNGKEKEFGANLYVTTSAVKGFLNCSSKVQELSEYSAEMTKIHKFIILEDKNTYGNVAFEVYNFKFSDETQYTDLLAKHNNKEEIKLNEITGTPLFDNENLTISFENPVNNDEYISEFGEENLVDYNTIKQYFTNTKGFSCTYKKID